VNPRVGVCDYGVGNLRSVERALRVAGADPVISGDPDTLVACDGVVLPGVGAFSVAAGALWDTGLGPAVRELARRERPVLRAVERRLINRNFAKLWYGERLYPLIGLASLS